MATKRMLVDASHPEETRVVVLDGTKLEGYDVEVASRRQLKGNIYLAKVTRVEPSLQAAFVEYGGNRHGFLAFSEIHPDYYQIPVADRQALLAEHQEAESEEAVAAAEEDGEEAEPVEVVGGDDDEDLERRPPRRALRHYKIQEVIKRRQILLVQVVKEERGNKGAALTTYLSLAGRYCVLMPNTSRGGGISRKIGSLTDRKRLKKILTELEVPEGMGVIVRTAGLGRTKAEIKRDYEYLMRLWGNIRETTLTSIAPALVYEEASLIKRSIRDLYGRDTEEIVIQGEPEYRIAKEFMKLFIPSHAKRVKLHDDSERPLFSLYQVESQLDAMHLPSVPLKSGGYIVINPTEALVSIDVNSGRATRERHIEETALRTNIEAADEIGRQLRLRDLAGLIVIDFIDMENSRNQGQVERRVKDAMKIDRARIQIGRISAFGLLELSRQRLRPSLLETSFEMCPYCSGMGVCRTTESTVLSILRKIEEEGQKVKGGAIFVSAAPAVAMYLLNQKRKSLAAMEARFQLNLVIASDGTFAPAEHRLERVKGQTTPAEAPAEPVAETADESVEETEKATGGGEETAKRSRRRRPRRRRRPDEEARPLVEAEEAGENADEEDDAVADVVVDAAAVEADADADADAEVGSEEGMAAEQADGEGQDELAVQDAARKPRRRGKRGGRRRPRRPETETAGEPVDDGTADDAAMAAPFAEPDADADAAPAAEVGEVGEVGDVAEAAGDDERADDHAPRAEPDPLEVEVEIGADAVAYGHNLDDGGRDEVEARAGEETDLEVTFERETPDAGPAPGEVAELVDAAAAEDENGDVSFEIVSYPATAPGEDGAADSAWARDPEAAEDDSDRRESSNGSSEPHGEAGAVADHDDEPDREADGADDEPPPAARTQVIRVGASGDLTGAPRRGWWQRFMN